jgi:LAO/AO transport system kinase
LEKQAIDDVWLMIEEYRQLANNNNALEDKRRQQNSQWMKKLLHDMLEQKLQSSPELKKLGEQLEKDVIEGRQTPFTAARQIIDNL